jgi:hypothetical protein
MGLCAEITGQQGKRPLATTLHLGHFRRPLVLLQLPDGVWKSSTSNDPPEWFSLPTPQHIPASPAGPQNICSPLCKKGVSHEAENRAPFCAQQGLRPEQARQNKHFSA